MKGEYKTNSNIDEQRREFVLDFIKGRGLIKLKDNLVLSEKVFVINAVLNWCFEKAHQKKMSPTLWEKYKRIIAQYVAGVVDIKWTNNNFKVTEVIDDNRKKRPTPRRRKK